MAKKEVNKFQRLSIILTILYDHNTVKMECNYWCVWTFPYHLYYLFYLCKLWFSLFSLSCVLFTFDSLEIAAPYTLSKFYGYIHWERQSRMWLFYPELEPINRPFRNCTCVCVHAHMCTHIFSFVTCIFRLMLEHVSRTLIFFTLLF